MKDITKVDLLKCGDNEYKISIDDVDQNTIQRKANESDEDFEKRANGSFDLSVLSLKTFKRNRKVVRSENIYNGS